MNYIDKVKTFANEKGGKFMAEDAVWDSSLPWRCKEGHEWSCSFAVAKKYWCPQCSEFERQSNQLTKYQKLASERDGELLNGKYLGAHIHHQWRCKNGHCFDLQPERFAQRWCVECNLREVKNKEFDVIKDVAEKRGGRCLSIDYKNNSTKMLWECGNEAKHQWWAVSASVKNGSWCPHCARPSQAIPSGESIVSKKINVSKMTTAMRSGLKVLPKPVWPVGKKKASDLKIGESREKYFLDSLPAIRKVAKEMGGNCEGESFPGHGLAMGWCCEGKHRWKMSLFQFQNGEWCKECQKISYTTQSKSLLKKMNLSMDGDFKSLMAVEKFRCKKGHVEETSLLNLFHRKHGCQQCRIEEKKDAVSDWAKKNGLIINGTVPNNKKELVKWECKACKGFEVQSPLVMMKRKNPCWTCYGKQVIGKVKETAIAKGGTCLSVEYKGSKELLMMKCNVADHPSWKIDPFSIINGSWCKYCSKSPPRTIEDARRVAEEKGGQCLSIEYKGYQEPMQWKCSNGSCATFTSSFNSVSMGQWCPTCKNKGENIARQLMKEIFGKDFPSAYPEWLRRKKQGRPMQLDGYCPELGFAFEYQGLQHSSRSKYLHATEEAFEAQKKRDEEKKLRCIKNNVVLVEIPQFSRTRDKEARAEIIRALLSSNLTNDLREKVEKAAVEHKVRKTGRPWLRQESEKN